MTARRFVVALLLLLCLPLLGLAGFNYWVDPNRLFGTPYWQDAPRPLKDTGRLVKPHQVWGERCDSILLGTSRGGHFSMAHPLLNASEVCNLSLAGSVMRENYRMFQHAQAIHPVKRVIIGLDYFSFSAQQPVALDFEERLAVTVDGRTRQPFYRLRDYLTALVSRDISRASWAVIQYQPAQDEIRTQFTSLEKSRLIEQAFMARDGLWLKVGIEHYRQGNYWFLEEQLGYFEALLHACHQHGTDLHLFISPIHARMQAAFHVVGIEAAWAFWKRRLVEINESVAAEYGHEPFVLWDFGILNERTTEPVWDELGKDMDWYVETSHFNGAFADDVLNLVLSPEADARGLAQRLSSHDLDAVLQQQAIARAAWRERQADTLNDLRDAARSMGTLASDVSEP